MRKVIEEYLYIDFDNLSVFTDEFADIILKCMDCMEISVETHAGAGTTFRLTMPLTLATFRGVLVRVDEHLFVLPTLNIERAVRVSREEIRTVENRETIRQNGQILPLVRLGDALELPVNNNTTTDNIQVMIIISGDTRIAFQVAQKVDSRTIIDAMGADKLLGKGDMLFLPPGVGRLMRAQGTLTDADLERWTAELNDEISAAVTAAEALPAPELETLFTDVYAEMPPALREQMKYALSLGKGTAFDGAFPL